MIILAVETSCDETAVALVRDGRETIAALVASQAKMHEIYGGVVPEIASRKHVEVITQLTDQVLLDANLSKSEIDAVAVSYAPGLIGALLVGLNFAKAVAYALDVPLIPVHHVRGHIAANYLAYPQLEPPFVCLCVSGGTSLIVDVKSYVDMEILGATRDDASGECFDKVARVLGLGYPGGPVIDRLSQNGDDSRFPMPQVNIKDAPMDLSFSGLKTATLNLIHNMQQKEEEIPVEDLSASLSRAVSDMLVPRVMKASERCGYQKVAVVGGVAANSRIRADLTKACDASNTALYLPPLSLCGDNAQMVGSQAYYEYLENKVADWDLNAYANRDISKG